MLFARNISYQIKDGKVDEFHRAFTHDVLPVLKNQPGFQDEVMLVDKGRGVAISLWQDRASAEKYEGGAYRTILDKLTPFLTNTPTIQTFDVSLSTLTH